MSMYIKIALLMLFTMVSGNLYAKLQGQERIDSLLKELPKQKEDTNKVKLLYILAGDYSTNSPDEGIKFAQQELDLATKLGWKLGVADANNTLGLCFGIGKSDHAKALEYYFKALKGYEEAGNQDGAAFVNSNIGLSYSTLGENTKSLDYYNRSLQAHEKSGNKRGIAIANSNIGVVYRNLGDYPNALTYLYKALNMFEEQGDKKSISNIISNISIVFEIQGDHKKTLEYMFVALKLDEELGDKVSVAMDASLIGQIYCDGLNDYPLALKFMRQSLMLDEEAGNKMGIANNTSSIANVYANLKNYALAMGFAKYSLKVSEELGLRESIAFDLALIGTLCLSIYEEDTLVGSNLKGDKIRYNMSQTEDKYQLNEPIPTSKPVLLHMAFDYLNKALVIAREINEPERIKKCYEGLALAYKLSGDYKKAFDFTNNFNAVKDSMLSNDNKVKIANMATQREQDLKEKQIAINKLEGEKKHAERVYFSVGLISLLLIVSGLFFSRKAIRKEKDVSEGLLLNILPSDVAKELKEKGYSDAKHFEKATVLFTDFKGFTQMSEKLSAEELVSELDFCFKGFDEIISRNGIEKIKTIGDSYMAVGGLPDPKSGFPEQVVKAALEMRDFISNRKIERDKQDKPSFEMRVGIHTGPVVAGIVGIKKFQYDIWGDTVNTASRMESSGGVGKVNISGATYELVKDKFNCEYRGEIDAKGKGMLKMYFVS